MWSPEAADYAERQRQAQLNALLTQAESDLLERRFDTAIALYDEARRSRRAPKRGPTTRPNPKVSRQPRASPWGR